MRYIAAIDPGATQSAIVVWDLNQCKIVHKYLGDNEQVVLQLRHLELDYLAIEKVASYGMPVGASVFETCFWSGEFRQIAKARDIEFEMIPRMDVKMWHCKMARAKDSNISMAIKDKYGKPGTKKFPNKYYNDATEKLRRDLWQAFALLAMKLERDFGFNPVQTYVTGI